VDVSFMDILKMKRTGMSDVSIEWLWLILNMWHKYAVCCILCINKTRRAVTSGPFIYLYIKEV